MPPPDPLAPKPQPSSPYDFIQQMPVDTGPPPRNKRQLVIIIIAVVMLLVVIVVVAVANRSGPNTNQNAGSQAAAAQLTEYTDSSAFKISYPQGFEPLPADDDTSETQVGFYKDANDAELNAFGVEISDAAESETSPPKVEDDFTDVLTDHTQGEAVTNVHTDKIQTNGQDGVKVTADFTSNDTPAKIILIKAIANNQSVVLWFTAEAANQAYLSQIDSILASFELY